MAVLNDNFTLRAPVPYDDRKGWWDDSTGEWKPFNDVQHALDTVVYYRYRTLTLPVVEDGDIVEYWFKEGIEDSDFTLKTSQVDLSNYYTKTELQTSGQAQVHWDNLTNIPDLSVTWDNITGDQSVIGNAGFTNDAGYITSGDLPVPLTFENGLREDNGVVKLGLDLTTAGTTNKGLLTEQTSLVLGDLLSQNITAFNLYDNASLSIQKSISGIGTQSIEFSGPGAIVPNVMLIVDAVNEKGLEELADYSSNKTQYSYVTLKMLNEVAGDIPDLTGYATETWVISQGYLTSVPWSFNVNNGDLTINGVTNNLDGRWLERSEGVITSGYGITVNGDLATGMGIELDTTVVDNRYLRKDVNDLTINSLSVGGNFGVAGNTELQGLVYFNVLTTGTTSDQMLVRDPVSNLVKYINMPSFGGEFTVANNAGTPQFTVANGQSLRINATGDASVAFNAGTKTITINSSGGSSGGGVDSWNARTGAVVPESGDYTTTLVTEGSNQYFTQARVRATPLTGFSATNSAIAATDTILQAFNKTQGQINARVPTSRTISISGTSGNISISGTPTQNLASNAAWTINLATVGSAGANKTKVTTDAYGRVIASAALVAGDLPSSVFQTISANSNPGGITITNGNSLQLADLYTQGRQDASVRELNNVIRGYRTVSGMTNYPGTSIGTGIRVERFSTASSQLGMDFYTNGFTGGGPQVWFKTFSGTSTESEWDRIAGRDWVTSQIPTDYVNTTSTQTGIAGNKSWTGAHNWSSSTNPSSVANTATIGGTSNGQFLRLTELGSSSISALLRGYASNGIQMLLNQGGIDAPVTSGNFAAGPYFAGGVPILATNTGGSVAVGPHGSGNIYLRPSGVNSSTGQIYIQPDGTTVVTGLSGSGTQMVVASPSGVLSRQAIPVVGNGTLSMSTGTGLSGSASFSANQSGNASFTVAAASGYVIPTTGQRDNWNTSYSNYFSTNPNSAPNTLQSISTNWDTISGAGAFVMGGSSTNPPISSSSANWTLLNLYASSNNSPQIALGNGGTGYSNGLWYRHRQGNPWYRVWSTQEISSTQVSNWNTAYGWGDYRQWGLGTFTNNNGNVLDANTPSETQFFSGGTSTTNRPPGTGHTYIHIGRASTIANQIAFDYDNDEAYFRRLRTTWQPWRRLWHDGNFNPSDYQTSITGAATTIVSSNLTANRALISNGSGKVAVSAVTSTELGYLDGVTSAIQTQLSARALTTTSITAGNGLSGGGTLAATRTITLGTPSNITLSSTNSVTTSSHTHAFAPGGTTAQYIRGDGTLATFPTIPSAVSLVTAGSTTVGAVRYAGTSTTVGQFNGGTGNPSGTTRLNYNGNLHVTNLITSLDIDSGGATSALRFITKPVGVVSGTTINMDSSGLQRLESISANRTYTLSNNGDGKQVQCTVSNSNSSNSVTVSVSGATLLGSNIIGANQTAVISIVNFGGGQVRYTVISSV